MAEITVYNAGIAGPAPYAEKYLQESGISIVDHPTPEITHLLLDVPCRDLPAGLLECLPENIQIVGGNLNRSELQGYRKIDLLTLDTYLARNAAITADCAIRVAAMRMSTVFYDTSALIIGWGRIGKCLAAVLKNIGCRVSVAARADSDRAILTALGYDSVHPGTLQNLHRYSLIFNTVPAPVLNQKALSFCPDSLKIDLASSRGLDGPDVIWARGLPGLYAPESSGKLIAETFIREVMT